MKKVVLVWGAFLFAGLNANAAEAPANDAAAMKDTVIATVKTAADTATEEDTAETVAVIDINTLSAEEVEKLNEGNWEYHKAQVLNSLKEVNEKYAKAQTQKDEKAMAELDKTKKELFEKLEDLDKKIMEDGNDAEMKKAKLERGGSGSAFKEDLGTKKNQILKTLMDTDKKIKEAEGKKDIKEVDRLNAEKEKLIKDLDKADVGLAKAGVMTTVKDAKAEAKDKVKTATEAAAKSVAKKAAE